MPSTPGRRGTDRPESVGSVPVSESQAPKTKPSVTIEGDAPADLVIDDLSVGDGTEATNGSTVDVHYVGVLHSNGRQFDASWDRGQPLSFRLGAGMVIAGLGPGRGRHEGRRSSPARHPGPPGLRQPRRRRSHRPR